jgi:hypothetical protein
MKLMIDTDTAKKLTLKYEKFHAVISPLSCVPLTVACQLLRLYDATALRVRRDNFASHAQRVVADPFSNATPLRWPCDSVTGPIHSSQRYRSRMNSVHSSIAASQGHCSRN